MKPLNKVDFRLNITSKYRARNNGMQTWKDSIGSPQLILQAAGLEVFFKEKKL